MARASDREAFRLLFHEFFAQLFASESAVSDHQVKAAMIGILAFLITPGVFFPMRLADTFELASLRFPFMVGPLTHVVATMFVTFGIVAVGLIAAFEWDALAFDRRDAMVLGPLPVTGRTIVAAKLAALGALLLVASSGINLLTAVTFSLVAGTHQPPVVMVRLFFAHVVTTMSASTFVFCTLVTVRAALGLAGRGIVALGTLFQFATMAALLCFIIFAPSSLQLQWHQVAHHARQLVGVRMAPIPAWTPTRWFIALYDAIRGAAPQGGPFESLVAVALTLASVAAAAVAVLTGYRQQLRSALTPSATTGVVARARLARAAARVFAGWRAPARASADFIVATLARSRAQQGPIAINAAIGVVMIALDLSWRGSDFSGFTHPSAALARAPLLLAFWLAVGLRASFFLPSELRAAWAFRVNGADVPGDAHAAIRGAMSSLLVPPMAALSFVVAMTQGGRAALQHAAVVAAATLVLVELVAVTVPFLPFTRPYEPGHAKLKTRWPVYLAGVYLFAYALSRIERACQGDPGSVAHLVGWLLGAAVLLEVVGQVRARRRSTSPQDESFDEADRIAVLDLGPAEYRAMGH